MVCYIHYIGLLDNYNHKHQRKRSAEIVVVSRLELHFNRVSDKQILTAAELLTDIESADRRNKNHSNSRNYTGET